MVRLDGRGDSEGVGKEVLISDLYVFFSSFLVLVIFIATLSTLAETLSQIFWIIVVDRRSRRLFQSFEHALWDRHRVLQSYPSKPSIPHLLRTTFHPGIYNLIDVQADRPIFLLIFPPRSR